jgi:hypothetical protein
VLEHFPIGKNIQLLVDQSSLLGPNAPDKFNSGIEKGGQSLGNLRRQINTESLDMLFVPKTHPLDNFNVNLVFSKKPYPDRMGLERQTSIELTVLPSN